jgi:hypothetical protein
MNVLTDTWRQLVRRRLWPVALLLVAALAAVPFVLAKEPTPAPAAPAAPQGKLGQAAEADPIVALATDADRTERRRVLGARKDPFAPQPCKKDCSKKDASADAPGSGEVPGSGKVPGTEAPGGGASAPGGSEPPSGSVPPSGDEPAKKPSYPKYALTVRFGGSEADSLEKMTVTRLEALPSEEEPMLMYLGVEDGGKVAVFMVDSGVVAQGDGRCEPDPATCETIRMREGDTEFFDVVGEDGATAQYQLDLVEIHTKKKSGKASKAQKATTSEAAGRKLMRKRIRRSGPLGYRFDSESGTLQRVRAEARVGRSVVAGL